MIKITIQIQVDSMRTIEVFELESLFIQFVRDLKYKYVREDIKKTRFLLRLNDHKRHPRVDRVIKEAHWMGELQLCLLTTILLCIHDLVLNIRCKILTTTFSLSLLQFIYIKSRFPLFNLYEQFVHLGKKYDIVTSISSTYL